jgi:hypothetical protein
MGATLPKAPVICFVSCFSLITSRYHNTKWGIWEFRGHFIFWNALPFGKDKFPLITYPCNTLKESWAGALWLGWCGLSP